MTEILFKPTKKQRQLQEAVVSGDYDFICYGGAMGGGKTFGTLSTLIALCRIFPGSKWAVIRESENRLRRMTIPSFNKLCPKNFVHKQNSLEVIFNNDSQIIFVPESLQYDPDLDGIKGLEVNGVLLEQLEELSYKLFDEINMRIGRNRIDPMPPMLKLATINPTQLWPRKEIYEPYLSGNLPDRWLYLEATIKDNPELYEDPNYMQQFDNMDPTTRARLIDGDWDAFSNEDAYIYTFDYYRHTEESLQFDVSKPITLSFDFNVDPMTCVARQGDNHRLKYIQEFRMENSDIFKFTERIRDSLPPKRLLRVTGDPSGNARHVTSSELKNNFEIIKRVLSSKPGYHHVTLSVLKANPSHERQRNVGNILFAHFPEIQISRTGCPELIKDIQFVQAKHDGKRDKTAEAKAKKGHLLDCLLIDFCTYYMKHAMKIDKFSLEKN